MHLPDVLDETSGLTPRHALFYVVGLPFESNTMSALRGVPAGNGWSPDTYMLANVVDVLQQGNHLFISANSKKKPTAPKPIDRPGSESSQPKPKTNMFAAMARKAHEAGNRK